jgi:hypothetical protein
VHQGTNGDEDRSKRQEEALRAIIERVEVAHSQKCLSTMKLSRPDDNEVSNRCRVDARERSICQASIGRGCESGSDGVSLARERGELLQQQLPLVFWYM